MAYTQRDNSGSAFRNDRKREGKKDPDFNGSGVVNGVDIYIDIWQNPPKGGKKGYFSIGFRNKEARPQQGAKPQKPTRPEPPQRQRPAPPGAQRSAARPVPPDPDLSEPESLADLAKLPDIGF